jgi:hypothetical protein
MNTNYSDRRSIGAASAICRSMTLMAGVCSAADAAAEANDLWTCKSGFRFGPPVLDGEIGVQNRSVHVDEDFTDIVDIPGLRLRAETRGSATSAVGSFFAKHVIRSNHGPMAEPGKTVAGTLTSAV